MKEAFSENPEFFHRKRKFLAAMKSGKGINVEELVGDDELMYDKETVLCMLQTQGGDQLLHVSADLRDDEDVVFQACTNKGGEPAINDASSFQYASDRIKSSEQFVAKLKKYWLDCRRVDQAFLVSRYFHKS